MKHDCNYICLDKDVETVVGQDYQYKEDDHISDVKLIEEGVDAEGMVFLVLEVTKVLHEHFSGPGDKIMRVNYNPKYANVAYSGMWRLYPKGTYVLAGDK